MDPKIGPRPIKGSHGIKHGMHNVPDVKYWKFRNHRSVRFLMYPHLQKVLTGEHIGNIEATSMRLLKWSRVTFGGRGVLTRKETI